MSKTINDYTAAVSIDATNDYFLLEQSSAYVRINRSIMLGITGSPVGTSDSQTLTNKILGNTNAVTLKTNGFTLQDAADTTKQLIFSLSGITTATTRTLTVPNASATLATLTGVEVLTNKTLTSPVVNGGTIDNATITVDSIAGHTSGTVVTVAGLQISAGVLNTANAVTATSIADGAIQPKALVTGTGSGWSWTSYTPTPTNVTLGNGTLSARYIQVGKTVFYRGEYTPGSTSSVGGNIAFSIPVTSRNDSGYETGVFPIGNAIIAQTATNQWSAIVYLSSTTTMSFQPMNATATNATTTTTANATNPFTWSGANGVIAWNVMYEVT